jgi:hypothetical protein
MVDLKLSRLPDRTPVKLSIQVTPQLQADLTRYADAYEATYGQREAIADLIPFMLASFLEADRGFARFLAKGSS